MVKPRWAQRCSATISFVAGLTVAAVGVDALQPRHEAFDFETAAAGAMEALMSTYNKTSGLWGAPQDPPWWQSGVALQAVLDYMLATGSREYLPQVRNTIRKQRKPLPWWPEGGGEFRADSTDDTGWWALAMTSMYELTGEDEWLDVAELDEAYMWDYWNTTTCGGGLIWNIPRREYHNAISNELYLTLTARLHRLVSGDDDDNDDDYGDGGEDGDDDEDEFLHRSLIEWDWFAASGMINDESLINDGLTQDEACVNNGQTTWTYNQGVLLGGLVDLYKATGNVSYVESARAVADAVLASDMLVQDGILTEDCPPDLDCDLDGPVFKGVFVRYLARLDRELPPPASDRPYRAFIEANARSAYKNARNGSDFYGYRWQGPFDNYTLGRQVSGVNLMIAGLDWERNA